MNDAYNTCRKTQAILKARNATFARRSIEFSRHYATVTFNRAPTTRSMLKPNIYFHADRAYLTLVAMFNR